ncbi:MAG: hypothetical protein ACD_51C00316G0011 [uncultured bacterium]|nr:MAG: hypothetical protein ACD_51C00316G0011 [uncultured bacterium]OGJ47074.1 MAG: hypothetical protein A2244_05045 [Candidatus Peregrinibacteria bacterium RIFOXYA2_FULL_41_18]OGJ49762.1 MAG: hypothetical protein A2344_03705 [Candidatus Peregrinibacteria bacterium RIFOXYB12_FULL_41_12]OGJ52651.1 MAG: hypothetical protein A2448_00285 [Candidatus Peregrinibacteria bacterium RIFOXYC2_FULL_41_22]OGJ54018.1 MAG: hypothetical protein A2336_05395 [Candidatus Peregrinibacteria bacterium RIFOXYB2_FULL
MQKILITGGAGFVGSHLADRLVKLNYNVIVFDNFSTGKVGNLKNIKNRIKIIKGDIRDAKQADKACKDVDFVLHHAAQIFVPVSIKNPMETLDINAKGTLNILMAAKNNGIKKVILASSSAVYGDLVKMPIDETSPVRPLSPYGISKAMGEYYCQVFSKLYGINTFIFRYFNIFGSRQDPSSPYSGVISKFMDLSKKSEPLTIYGNGEQSRDFIPVGKVVEANIAAIKSTLQGSWVFNIGGGKAISIKDLAKHIKKIGNSNSKVRYVKARDGDIMHSCASVKKAQSMLAWSEEYDFQKELSKIKG